MTRGQRKRAERRAELLDKALEWLAAAGILAFMAVFTIIVAAMG